MKKHLMVLLGWVAAFLISTSAAISAEPVLVVNTGDNPIKPYKWFEQDGKPVGPDIDIVTTLFQWVGVKITIEPIPFNRILYNVERGESFGAFVAYKIAEREGKLTIEEVDTNEARILMLNRGRSDAVIANFHVMQYHLQEFNLTEKIVTLLVPFFPPRATYLLISKAIKIPDKAEFIEHLQQELRAMQKEGLLDEIASRYPGYSYSVLPRER